MTREKGCPPLSDALWRRPQRAFAALSARSYEGTDARPKRLPDFVYGSTTYVVEKLVETEDILKERLEASTLDFGARYILRGPLGAEYWLVPNQPNPTLFFAVNAKSFLQGTPFDGRLFTERDGRLMLAWPWTRKLLVGLIALGFVLVLTLSIAR